MLFFTKYSLDFDNSIKNAYGTLSASWIIDSGRRSIFLYTELKFILAFASFFKSFNSLSIDLEPSLGFFEDMKIKDQHI